VDTGGEPANKRDKTTLREKPNQIIILIIKRKGE
jgi:hypothetical protein